MISQQAKEYIEFRSTEIKNSIVKASNLLKNSSVYPIGTAVVIVEASLFVRAMTFLDWSVCNIDDINKRLLNEKVVDITVSET